MLGKPFPWDDKIPWTVYYLACTRKPYERNLVKNHSGAMCMKHWDLTRDADADWWAERPPCGMPKLPQTEPLFKDRQSCFATFSRYLKDCTKVHTNYSSGRRGDPSNYPRHLSTTYRGKRMVRLPIGQ